MKHPSPRQLTFGLLVTLALVAGCPTTVSRPRVHGTVTFQGQPVGNQTLVLYSAGEAGEFFTQQVAILADGTFTGEVSVPGTYRIAIAESRAAQENRQPAEPRANPIPARYRNPDSSNLTWEIHGGDNMRSFELVP